MFSNFVAQKAVDGFVTDTFFNILNYVTLFDSDIDKAHSPLVVKCIMSSMFRFILVKGYKYV